MQRASRHIEVQLQEYFHLLVDLATPRGNLRAGIDPDLVSIVKHGAHIVDGLLNGSAFSSQARDHVVFHFVVLRGPWSAT